MIWPLVEYILFFVFLINFKCWALQSICYGIVSIFYQYVKLQIDMSQTLEEKKKKRSFASEIPGSVICTSSESY